MQSFRTEIENPVVEQDIIELGQKIEAFKTGKLSEDKFKSLRLARGVYGQRQPGVQMIRIKLPYGKVTTEQLLRIADVSDEYSIGKLHITTRQDVQIHYVSLDRTPQLWEELEKDAVTIREACGNTVRNITASAFAGIDPEEAFDVTPYADATFKYLLRNPVNQDLGRKFKIAFSGSEKDSAFTFINDLGFIAKVKDGKRGFKVLLAGGLGAQPHFAIPIYDFLEVEEIIPFTEAVLRIFDRYGERANRNRARLKFLIKKIGVEEFLKLVEEEQKAVSPEARAVKFDIDLNQVVVYGDAALVPEETEIEGYSSWYVANVYQQKQEGYYAVKLRIPNGDITTEITRKLVEVVRKYASNDLRFTVSQGLVLKYISKNLLKPLYLELKELNLAEAGAESTVDITSCPGTDTCNLGITNSTSFASIASDYLEAEFPNLIYNKDLQIKISGCMNSCGQHSLASIGFHGSSSRVEKKVLPALQVLLGGGLKGDGDARVAEKVIKVPSKRGVEVLDELINDYLDNQEENEKYYQYFERQGKPYFYELLKPFADTSSVNELDFVDWGSEEVYQQAIGVGECAGVTIDLVSTLIFESEEKLDNAKVALEDTKYADSIYFSYASLINSAKALLTQKGEKTNSQAQIIEAFDKVFVETGEFPLKSSFRELTFKIKDREPSVEFALEYFNDASRFYNDSKSYSEQ